MEHSLINDHPGAEGEVLGVTRLVIVLVDAGEGYGGRIYPPHLKGSGFDAGGADYLLCV